MQNPFGKRRVVVQKAPKPVRKRATAAEMAQRAKIRAESELMRREAEYLQDLRVNAPEEYHALMRQRLGIREPKAEPERDRIKEMAATINDLKAAGIIPKGKVGASDDDSTRALVLALAPVLPGLLEGFGLLKHTGPAMLSDERPPHAAPAATTQGAAQEAAIDETPFAVAVLAGRSPAAAAAAFRQVANPATVAELGRITEPAVLAATANAHPGPSSGWLAWLAAPERSDWTRQFLVALGRPANGQAPAPTPSTPATVDVTAAIGALEPLAPHEAATWCRAHLPADVLAQLIGIQPGQEAAALGLAPIAHPELAALTTWLRGRMGWTVATLEALRSPVGGGPLV